MQCALLERFPRTRENGAYLPYVRSTFIKMMRDHPMIAMETLPMLITDALNGLTGFDQWNAHSEHFLPDATMLRRWAKEQHHMEMKEDAMDVKCRVGSVHFGADEAKVRSVNRMSTRITFQDSHRVKRELHLGHDAVIRNTAEQYMSLFREQLARLELDITDVKTCTTDGGSQFTGPCQGVNKLFRWYYALCFVHGLHNAHKIGLHSEHAPATWVQFVKEIALYGNLMHNSSLLLRNFLADEIACTL